MTDVHAHDREFEAFTFDHEVVTRLAELPADGVLRLWPKENCLVRRVSADLYVGVAPRMFTWAVIVGHVDDEWGYDDHWCYSSLFGAVAAANVFDGTGDPVGWHRHPRTGRRRPNGNPRLEYTAL